MPLSKSDAVTFQTRSSKMKRVRPVIDNNGDITYIPTLTQRVIDVTGDTTIKVVAPVREHTVKAGQWVKNHIPTKRNDSSSQTEAI